MNPHGKYFFNREKSVCTICGKKPCFWLPRGHKNEILQQYQMVGAGRRFVDCPFCGSSDRDRLVYIALQSLFFSQTKRRFLHIAPEKPIWRRWNREVHTIIGLDKRTKGYRFTYNKEVLQGDLLSLPFTDGYFDGIIANHVLEHISNESKALNEIHRVLTSGGLAMLQVPYSPILDTAIEAESHWNEKDCSTHLGQYDHRRVYGHDTLDHWSKWGFEPMLFEIPSDIRTNFRIHPFEPLFLLKKV